jgi:broad specificity phosphatase PhoE
LCGVVLTVANAIDAGRRMALTGSPREASIATVPFQARSTRDRATPTASPGTMSWPALAASQPSHPAEPIARDAETWAAYLQRTTAILRDILARHGGGTVLIVGHGETVTATAHHFLGLPSV